MEACIESPQTLLHKILKSRGYLTETHNALETDYYSAPTTDQIGRDLVEAVNQNDKAMLAIILKSGCDKNPCNGDGYSLLHMICRKANVELLLVLLAHADKEQGKSILSICDNYGRTPLHEACLAAPVDSGYFDMIKRILEIDVTLLFLKDCRGCFPLSNVRPENFQYWNIFLHNKKDLYWPPTHDLQKQNSVKRHRHMKCSEKIATGTPVGKGNKTRLASKRTPKNYASNIEFKSNNTLYVCKDKDDITPKNYNSNIDSKSKSSKTLDVCNDKDTDTSLFRLMEAEMKIILDCMDATSQEQIPWTPSILMPHN